MVFTRAKIVIGGLKNDFWRGLYVILVFLEIRIHKAAMVCFKKVSYPRLVDELQIDQRRFGYHRGR